MNNNHESERLITPPFEILKYDPKIDNLSELKKMIKIAYQTNVDFFGKEVNGIKINFIYSDKELADAEENLGMTFQDWHKNLACHDTVWIFSPKLPKGKDCQQHIVHEFNHIFINKLFYEGNPTWLKEGIAQVVAGKNKDEVFKSNIKFKEAHYGLDFQKHPIYNKSTVFTRYLIDEFGKEKLFTLLNETKEKIGTNNNYDDFCGLFNEVYGIDFETTENKFMEKHTISIDK